MSKKAEFLSKDNITRLYKETITNTNLQGLPRDSKSLVVEIVTNKMKDVYKSIDFSKVTRKNESQIFKQFNDMCLESVQQEIKNSELFDGEDTQVSRLKFNRDFNSGPERRVQFMERPKTVGSKISTKNIRNKKNNFEAMNMSVNVNQNPVNMDPYSMQGLDSNQVSHDADELGQFFTSPQNFSTNDQDNFSMPMPKKLDDMTKERAVENQGMSQRPPTPDFLKPMETQERKDNFDMVNNSMNNSMNMNNSINNNEGFQPVNNTNSVQQNNNMLDSYNGDANFFSIDNMDKPLVDTKIEEDNSSFEDRLKKLTMERSSISIPDDNKQSSSQSSQQMPQQMQQQMPQQMQQQLPQFNEDDKIKDQIDQEKQKINEEKEELIQMKQQFQQMIAQQQMQNKIEQQKLEQQKLDQQRLDQQKLELQKLELQKSQLQREKSIEQFSEVYTNDKKKYIPSPSLNRNNSNDNFDKLKKENNNLRSQISQMKDAKNLINEKFQELNKKNDMIRSNLEILNQRELEVNNRENDVKSLINNYKYLLNSRFYQINVTSNENKSKYEYYFEPLNSIVSLKIVSCSLPIPRFNIDDNSNKLLISINDENIEIKIKKGFYSIDRLIEILNFNYKNYNLVFALNENQKLNLSKIDINEDVITLNSTILSDKILGFGNESKFIDYDYTSIDAQSTWDLRLHDRLFLYLKNINSEPITILYFNGKSESTINFENPIELSNLEIEIKDSDDNLYDFNNLKHSINIQLEITNQMFDEEISEDNLELDNISEINNQFLENLGDFN